jgi:hypothetical protein
MNNQNNSPGESFKELFINYLSDRTKNNPEAYEAIFWEVIDVIGAIEDIIEQKTSNI